MTEANQFFAIGAAFVASAWAMEGMYSFTRAWQFRVAAVVGHFTGLGFCIGSVSG